MAKPKREARQEVIKNSAAIQIDNSITLLQRRTWNALLFHAYNSLETEEEYSISLQYLARLVGYDSHDMDYLKEASKAMMRCIVEWDILDKDGSPEWGATALLAQVKITRGMCTYAYSPELRRRLHNPAMYARLDLNLQKQFESKYSLALWELCTDYLGSGRDYGETPFIHIATFRKLMGIAERMYPAFMNFNQKVIKPAVEEINRVSDFRVVVDYQRQGRKVIAIKFQMTRIRLLPEPALEQETLFPDMETIPAVMRELQDAGMSIKDAQEIWGQGFGYIDEEARPTACDRDTEAALLLYIREKIHLLKRKQAAGTIENSTGFLLQAIRQNYANPEFADELRREASAARQKAKHEQEKRVKALELQKAALEKARDRELEQLHAHVAATVPEVVEQAAAVLLVQEDGFRFVYERERSALDNYQLRPSLQVFFHPYLESQDPTRFEAIKQRYAVQIAAVDAQIATIGG
jgi:hypothetical protein